MSARPPWRTVPVVVALVLLAAACSGGNQSSPPTTAPPCVGDGPLAEVTARLDELMPTNDRGPWARRGVSAFENRSPSSRGFADALGAACGGVWSRTSASNEATQIHLAWDGDRFAAVIQPTRPPPPFPPDVMYEDVFWFGTVAGELTDDGWFLGAHHGDEAVVVGARGWGVGDVLRAWGDD